MSHKINRDVSRFRRIVDGAVRRNLREYIRRGELIGRRGRDSVSIPVPSIDIPHFRYGSKEGGVGMGDGDFGDAIGSDGQPGPGAGDSPGEHILEVEIDISDLARILGEELELPRIEPKGKNKLVADKDKYTGIARSGPESLRHFKRTYKEALKREMSSGTYNPCSPVIPIRDDKRYRSWKTKPREEMNAAILYMMDISGSMGYNQKELVRSVSFWIDLWLRSQYKGIESRYIVHDTVARVVGRHDFFHLRESGGTKISSAYDLCDRLIDAEFPPDQWNIYPFHFSDGDNWAGDEEKCFEILEKRLLPKVNLFCYGQVKSAHGNGQFGKDLAEHFSSEDKISIEEIKGDEDLYKAIKQFLGKGR